LLFLTGVAIWLSLATPQGVDLMKKKQFFFKVALLVCVLLGIEAVGWYVLGAVPDMEKTRRLLLSNKPSQAWLNTVSQPYLLYISAPNYSKGGFKQHNAQGYRGEAVPLRRQSDNTLRILFMGGSTTYGEGVLDPMDAYPAQVGRMLAQDPDFSGIKIEVINAGIRYGTSAEMLTHYLFKYRYYKPDLVVMNPGGNDPIVYRTRYAKYHPDFSNVRKSITAYPPLRFYARWLFHSRAFSAIAILLFYPEIPEGNIFVHNGERLPSKWFQFESDEYYKDPRKAPIEEIAFYRNNSSIAREIKGDGAIAFFLSYQGNPFDKKDQKGWRLFYDWEESILERVAREQGVAYAAFPLDRLPQQYWVDASHNDAAGYGIKAAYVTEHIKPLLIDWMRRHQQQ
jgi:lysophospholipase L1-like esterase